MAETEDKIAKRSASCCGSGRTDGTGSLTCGNRKNLRRDTTPELRITHSMRSKSGEKSCRRTRLIICSVNTAVLRFALPVNLLNADTQRLPSWEDTDIFHKSAPAKVRQREISRFNCVQTSRSPGGESVFASFS